MDPTNYQLNVATPFQAALAGYQGGMAIRNDQTQQQALAQQQAQQLAQQQQQAQVIHGLIANPNAGADDYANAVLLVPSMKDQLKQAWEAKNSDQQQAALGDMSQYFAAVKQGQPQLAADMMNSKADAMEAAGAPSQQVQALRTNAQVVSAHPEFARTLLGMTLASTPGGDKVIAGAAQLGTDQRADALAPADIATKTAEAKIKGAEAAVAPTKAATDIANTQSQINERAGRLALDQDALASNIGLKVQELRRKPGAIDLPASAETIINNAASNAQLSRQSAAQLSDLADQFEKADPQSFGAGTYEALKQLTGSQDYVTALRKEYVRLRSTQVNSLLPPGPASDVDVRNAMAGFPKETADPKELTSFMRGMAKLQNYSAQVEDARSEWVNQVGTLGKPTRDIDVGGVSVPAGTTFSDFMKKALKPLGAQTQPPAVGIKQRLLQTYGGGGLTAGAY